MAHENNPQNIASADITNVEAVSQTVDSIYDGLSIVSMETSAGFDKLLGPIDDMREALLDVASQYQILEQTSGAQTYVSGTGNTGFVMSASISVWNLDSQSESKFEASITRAIKAAISSSNVSFAPSQERQESERQQRDGSRGKPVEQRSDVAPSNEDATAKEIRKLAEELRRDARPDVEFLDEMHDFRLASEAAMASRASASAARDVERQKVRKARAEVEKAKEIYDWGHENGYLPGDFSSYTIDEIWSAAGNRYENIQKMSPESLMRELMTPAGLTKYAKMAQGAPDWLLGQASTIRGWGNDITSLAKADNVSGALKSLGTLAGDVPDMGSSLTALLGSTATADAAGVGLAGLLEGLGLTEAAGVVGGAGAAIAPALATAAPWLAAAAVVLPLASQAIDFANDEKAQERFMTQLTTGMSEEDVKKIQDTLTSGGLKFGSSDYKQGYGWITDAVQNRKVGGEKLTADKASKYYEEMVIRGGMSIAELNEALDTLSATVKNTNLSLDEVNANIKTMSSNISSAYGGNSVLSQQGAYSIQEYFTGGSGRGGLMATDVAGMYDFAKDVRAVQEVGQVMSANPNLGYDEAMVIASFQMAAQGYLPDADQFFYRPMIRGGKRFFQYINEGDFNGLRDALEVVWNYDTSRGAYSNMGFGALQKAMLSIGVPNDVLTDPDTLVDYLQNDVMSGVSDMGTGESSAVKNADAKDREEGNWFEHNWVIDPSHASAVVGRSVESGDTTSEGSWHGVSNKRAVMSLLDEAGIYDPDMQITQTAADETTEALMNIYSESAARDSGVSFQSWLATDEGASQARTTLSRYMNLNSDSSSQARDVNVSISIGYRGNAGETLYAEVENVGNQKAADSGYGGGVW